MQGAGSRGENNRAVVQRVDKAHRVMFPELQDEMNRRDIATTYVNKNNLNNRQNNTYLKYVGYYDSIWDFFKEIGEIAINTSRRIDEGGWIAAASNQVEQQTDEQSYLDIPGRVELSEDLSNADDAREQMELIVEFLKKPDSSNLSKCLAGEIPAMRFHPTVRSAFIYQKIKTMMYCYTNHCQCSLDVFASFHKEKKSSRDMKKICMPDTCNHPTNTDP